MKILLKTLEADVEAEEDVIQTCEMAGFTRKVSPGQCFKTIHDIEEQARLIVGGKDSKEERQTVFFTAPAPWAMNQHVQ